MQAIKWHLCGYTHELAAIGAEQMLLFFLNRKILDVDTPFFSLLF
jgi:hypothetical protein